MLQFSSTGFRGSISLFFFAVHRVSLNLLSLEKHSQCIRNAQESEGHLKVVFVVGSSGHCNRCTGQATNLQLG